METMSKYFAGFMAIVYVLIFAMAVS